MELKKQSLQLRRVLCTSFMGLLILLLYGIPPANAQTPQQIAKKALAATVLLTMKDANGKTLGLGSGFFVRTDQIATNLHVIDGAAQGTAKRVGQEMEYAIEGVTAMDEKNDLAILQVAAPDIQQLPLGDSDTVEIGDRVYVAGNPKGFLEGTFSDGIISGIRGDSTEKRIQITAPISPGSSGGPVLNRTGEVIGVSMMTIEGGQNLNFAIPSNYLKGLLARLGPAKPLSEGKQSISAETYFLRAWVKDQFGNYKGAITDYDKVIHLKPDDANVYYNRGTANGKLGQYTAAINDFDTAIRLKLDYADAYVARSMVKGSFGDSKGVIADLDTAIRLKPDDAKTYIWRGMAKEIFGDSKGAIADLDTAIRLKPDDAKTYYRRGNAKFDLGQDDAAINDYDTAIRLKPDFARAYVGRGLAKHNLRRTMEAKQDFQTALKLAEQAGDARLKTQIESAIRDSR